MQNNIAPGFSQRPAWYSVYSSAILECDGCKALSQIELAGTAIQDRLAEFAYLGVADQQEFLDIESALEQLQMLLCKNQGRDGRILWQR